MFKQRLLTGITLTIIAVLAVLYLPNIIFIALTLAIFLFAAWEWSGLVKQTNKLVRIIYVISFLSLFYLAWISPVMLILLIAFIWWLIAIALLLFYPKSAYWGLHYSSVVLSIGVLVLIPSWLAVNQIRLLSHGPLVLMSLLLLVWAADTGAYFSGRWLGKHKLSSAISPKKTWEGLYGGILLALIIAFLVSKLIKVNLIYFMILAFVVVLFSVIGDLLESLFKREAGLKDSGQYLPGHGGLLDRMDSLTAAAPIFLLGWIILQHII